MARFYFHAHEWGTTFEDHEGLGRADLDVARQDATRLARAFMSAEAAEGRPCLTCCVSVADVAGSRVVSVLPTTTADLPAS